METKVLEERIYYRIESPRGIMSDILTENDLEYVCKKGFFKNYEYIPVDRFECVTKTKRYKIGKIHKYVRKTTLTETEYEMD